MPTNRKKILVHACCAACLSYVFSDLSKDNYEIIVLFFNPQIENESEYKRRLEDITNFCSDKEIKLIVPTYDTHLFSRPLVPLRDDNSIKYISDKDRFRRRRCELCTNLLICAIVAEAKKLKLNYFTTTLLCSPYKDHNQIWDVGGQAAEDHNLVFYYKDFRKGYWTGRNFARNHDMMIPAYCGCNDSLTEGRLE